eukprot:scaffold168056_cov23-Tisochrysis_lutea.AAC.1
MVALPSTPKYKLRERARNTASSVSHPAWTDKDSNFRMLRTYQKDNGVILCLHKSRVMAFQNGVLGAYLAGAG